MKAPIVRPSNSKRRGCTLPLLWSRGDPKYLALFAPLICFQSGSENFPTLGKIYSRRMINRPSIKLRSSIKFLGRRCVCSLLLLDNGPFQAEVNNSWCISAHNRLPAGFGCVPPNFSQLNFPLLI